MKKFKTIVAVVSLSSSVSVHGAAPQRNLAVPPPSLTAPNAVLTEQSFAVVPVEPITVAAATLSIASSLKSLFGGGGGGDNRAIKRKLDELIAQNNQILQTLGQIVGILNNLGVTVRQNVRYEMIFDKQTQLMSESNQLAEIWSAELIDRNARRLATQRYRNDILPDVRDITRQLMDEGYGFAPADTIGHGMLMELWMSRRLQERVAYRREIGSTYVAYFDRTLNPALEGSPAKALADATAQRDRMDTILDAAEARVGTDGWTAETFRGTRSRESGRTTYYTDYRTLQTARGNRADGFTVTVREEILREYRYTEPSEGCRRCRDFAMFAAGDPGDPPDPGNMTPAGRVQYWNQVRQTWLSASRDVEVLSKVVETLTLYRSEAQRAQVNG